MNKVSDNGNAVSKAPERRRAKKGGAAQGILVLGMHRSGTSALTRVLNLLGCAISNNLLGEGSGNETGHWESLDAVALNDEMLASAGSSHDDWGPINDDWRGSAIRSQMVGRAREIIEDHAKLGPLFAIKDPRMCRLADVWIEGTAEAEVVPLVVLVLRNPAEVAASLESRDLMQTGYGELLWLRHLLDAEFLTRGQKRVVCQYDQLLSNWQRVVTKIKSELSVTFPRNSPKVHAEIAGFLSESHRHHNTDSSAVIEDSSYSLWLRRTLQIMLTWSDKGEDTGDYDTLDEIRAELDRAYGAFARLLLSQEFTGEAGSGSQLRGELAAALQAAKDLGASAQVREAELRGELTQTLQTAEAARLAAAEREGELAQQLDAEAARAQSMQSEIERLESVLEERSSSVADAEAEVGSERERRAEAEKKLAQALDDLREHQLNNAELAGQLAVAQSTLVQRQEELAQLLAQLVETSEKRVKAELEHDREREEKLKLELRLESADANCSDLESRLKEAQREAEQQAEISTINPELENRLTSLLQERDQDLGAAEAARGAAERQLAARFAEIATLTTMLRDETAASDSFKAKAQWLRRVNALSASFPRWWMMMPPSWRRQREHTAYAKAGLFHADKYLNLYPDVAENGMDPLRHYILHGMDEGRQNPT